MITIHNTNYNEASTRTRLPHVVISLEHLCKVVVWSLGGHSKLLQLL